MRSGCRTMDIHELERGDEENFLWESLVSEETNLLGRFGKYIFGLIGPCLRTGGNERYEENHMRV